MEKVSIEEVYYNIYLFFVIGIIIGLLLLFVSMLIVYQNINLEKMSSYECGFNPFEDARIQFDVHFYLVALLFIIFDLEISFLFIWVNIITIYYVISVIIIMIFLIVLMVGFLYEWKKGVLEW